MPLPTSTIGGWSSTQLVKVVKDILQNQPPRNLPTVTIGQARIVEALEVDGKIIFPNHSNFHIFGGNGEPAYENGWVNWGAPYFDAGYWKDPLGFVHLRGTIKSGTVGNPAVVLPPGIRPSRTAGPFIVLSNGAVGRVDVGSDGTVTPQSPSSNVYVVLDGIYFKVDDQ